MQCVVGVGDVAFGDGGSGVAVDADVAQVFFFSGGFENVHDGCDDCADGFGEAASEGLWLRGGGAVVGVVVVAVFMFFEGGVLQGCGFGDGVSDLEGFELISFGGFVNGGCLSGGFDDGGGGAVCEGGCFVACGWFDHDVWNHLSGFFGAGGGEPSVLCVDEVSVGPVFFDASFESDVFDVALCGALESVE